METSALDVTSAAPVASMTPDHLDGAITDLRAEMARIPGDLDRRRPEKAARLEQLYKARWGTGKIDDAPVSPDTARAPLDPAQAEPVEATTPDAAALSIALPPAPEGLAWDQPSVDALVDVAIELDVPAAEIRTWLERFAAHDPETALDQDEAEARLRAMWGEHTPARLAAARLAFQRLPVLVREHILNAGLDNDPDVIKRLAELGAPMVSARSAITAIRRDEKHPYNRPGHPGHEAARDEMERLYKRVYGTREV